MRNKGIENDQTQMVTEKTKQKIDGLHENSIYRKTIPQLKERIFSMRK